MRNSDGAETESRQRQRSGRREECACSYRRGENYASHYLVLKLQMFQRRQRTPHRKEKGIMRDTWT